MACCIPLALVPSQPTSALPGAFPGCHCLGFDDGQEGFGPSLALLEGNPSDDPAPSGLLHSSPTSLEGGTSEERETHTSNFNFEVGEMVAGFFLELLLILPAPSSPQISSQTF